MKLALEVPRFPHHTFLHMQNGRQWTTMVDYQLPWSIIMVPFNLTWSEIASWPGISWSTMVSHGFGHVLLMAPWSDFAWNWCTCFGVNYLYSWVTFVSLGGRWEPCCQQQQHVNGDANQDWLMLVNPLFDITGRCFFFSHKNKTPQFNTIPVGHWCYMYLYTHILY